MAVSKISNDYHSTSFAVTGHRGSIHFEKTGRIVNAWMNGDWTNVPSQAYTVIAPAGSIPEMYRPTDRTVFCAEQSFVGHSVLLYINSDGSIGVYNYGSAITSATNGIYNICYFI